MRIPSPRAPIRTASGLLRLAALGGLLALGAGCDQLPIDIEALMGGSGGLAPETQEKMKAGDIPAVYEAVKDVPKEELDVETAKYLAFAQLTRGEYAEADATLAAVAEKATPEELPGLSLRRAIVAMRAKNVEDVKKHALASGLPEGKLLAAEVLIIAFDQDAARELLQGVQSTPGAVGQTATSYLELLNGGPEYEALAEITALWALGDRSTACEQAAEMMAEIEDSPKKAELQLLWAGRAVTSGHPAVAKALIDEMTELPSPDQAWRRQAVLAMVAIAEGEYEKGLRMFEQLEEAGAPGAGLADAIGTAIALCRDQTVAKRLAGDLESIPVSKGLTVQGLQDDAVRHVPRDSNFREMMK
jgi:tetratricopeptide (TPR) repeat protein